MKVLCLLVCLACNYCFAQAIKLKPGLYKPGFISVTRFDSSRAPVKEQPANSKGRIIQLNIWYPSYGDARQLYFADYIYLAGKELDTSEVRSNWKQKAIDKYFALPESLKADKRSFISFLDKNMPMTGFANAKPLTQQFPLVLLMHGFAADYAYLAEYFAGNGYVVMQVPVKGTTQYELDYEGNGLETQVLDYEFALTVLQNEFPFYAEPKAAAGFSFGAQSAVAFALRNKSVKCIISFDGGIGSAFGAALLQKQPYYNAVNITWPLLHLYNQRDSYVDLNWFRSISFSSRFLAAINNMEHGYFTSFGLLNKIVPHLMGAQAPDPGNGYEAIMLLAKQFLDASLKSTAAPGNDFFKEQLAAHAWIKACLSGIVVMPAGS